MPKGRPLLCTYIFFYMKTNKLLRRNIRRIAKRKGITFSEAILVFYSAKSLYEIDKNILYSLHKNDVDLTRRS